MTVTLIVIAILIGIVYRYAISRKHRLNGTTEQGEHDWMSPYR